MDRLKTRVVEPEGPEDANVLIIGQAPGAEENATGRPFVGQAGQFLNRCLMQVGLPRPSCLVTNVFNQRPPKNKVDYFFQDAKNTKLTWEGEEHVEKLRKYLVILKQRRDQGLGGPNIILALGRESILVLTGKSRITKWRGSLLPCTLVPGFKVYPAFHPSYVNRLINEPSEGLIGEKKKQQQNVLPLFLLDLKRTLEQSTFPELRLPQRHFDVDLSFSEICAQLKKLISAKEGIVSVDIETLRGQSGPVVWMIGFSSSPDHAFCIPIIQNWKPAWSLEEEAKIWVLVSQVFLNPGLKKVFQGGMYDLSVLGRYYGLRLANGTYEDTMLCHHANYPYIKKALETLASIYTWEPYYKDEGKVHGGKRSSDRGEALYNCKDSSVTREILPVVHRDARELGTWSGYRRTLSIVPSLLGMMIRGVRIDIEKKNNLGRLFGQYANEAFDTYKEITGLDTNLNAHAQVKSVLYGYYDLPLIIDRKTKKPSSDKEALQKLLKDAKEEPRKAIEAILRYKKYSKLASTYTSMEIDEDGRIHTSYSFISTYRLNSSESPFGGGGNLQNIPKKGDEGKAIRSLFIPDSGKIMFAADYRQAEAMVVAWLCEDLQMINAYLNGEDVHWLKTRELFGILSSIVYDKKTGGTIMYRDRFTNEEHSLTELRDLGKIAKHAGNYGEGPYRLQGQLAQEGFHLSFSACKAIIQKVKDDPFVSSWQRRVREQIKATRTLTSCYGRKRYFMGRLNDSLFRAAYAFDPQNTVGEMTEVSIREVWRRFPYIDPLMNVHDEGIYQVDPSRLEEAMADVKSVMEQPLIINGRTLVIPVDFKVGPSWGELEEVV